MTNLQRKLAFFVCSILGAIQVQATHIVGGEIMYEYLGNNKYEIVMNMYFDCINGSPEALNLDINARIIVYSPVTRNIHRYRLVRYTSQSQVESYNYNCLRDKPNACVLRRQYKTTVTLPDIPGGYIVAYQRCCRNSTIVNLIDQENTGATFWTKIPERKRYGNNSSPVFDELPPNFLCLGQPLAFKHTATDKDGDSLVYELWIPYAGATDVNPIPDTPSLSPYQPIIYNAFAGYRKSNMMNGNPTLEIDPITGQLTVTPTRLGQFVVGISVAEYRNGVLLSRTLRDFQLNVINCNFDVVSAFTTPTQDCDKTVSFENLSQGALSYEWDFGDTSTVNDRSNAEDAFYRYPSPGYYTIRLISSSRDCADTFEREIRIPSDTEAYAGPDANICPGESVRIGQSKSHPTTRFEWTPEFFLSDPSVARPLAAPNSTTTYTVKKFFDYCFTEDDVQIRVGNPNADFDYEFLPQCRNLGVSFTNNSSFANGYRWEFGSSQDDDSSSAEEPVFDFEEEGKYTVTLWAILNNSCSTKVEKELDIAIDTIAFGGPDREICFGDSVQLGTNNPYSGAQFSWTPAGSVNPDNFPKTWAKPEKTTEYVVTRSIPECAVTDTVVVTVDRPDPFFKLAYTPPCDGLNIKAYNFSNNCDSLFWDFGAPGENDTSSVQDTVRYTYPANGEYTIALEGISLKGCSYVYRYPLNVFRDTGAFAGPDTSVCIGQSIEIGYEDSVSFATFTWLSNQDVSNDSISNPSITPQLPDTYVVAKAYPECTFYDTAFVDVFNPQADFAIEYDPFCDVLDVTFVNNSAGADSFVWDMGFTDGISSSTDSIISRRFPAQGNYQVQLFAHKQQCTDTQSNNLFVFVDTGAYVIPDTVVCLDDSISVGREDTVASAFHFWSPSEGLSDDRIANPVALPSRSIQYVHERRFANCTYFDTIALRVAEPNALFDTTVVTYCDGFEASFFNESDKAERYEWVFSNGNTSTETDERQYFDFGDTLRAELYAIDAHCVSSFTVEKPLRPFTDFTIDIPNVFSPNGDGVNDCFTIEIPDLPEDCKNFELRFFNRWGQEVFLKEVEDQNGYCWDGRTSQGQSLSTGTYFYMVSMKGRNFHGTVTLLK